MCLTWTLRNIALTITTQIAVVFWTLIIHDAYYDTIEKVLLSAHTHGVTLFLILADFILCRIPV